MMLSNFSIVSSRDVDWRTVHSRPLSDVFNVFVLLTRCYPRTLETYDVCFTHSQTIVWLSQLDTLCSNCQGLWWRFTLWLLWPCQLNIPWYLAEVNVLLLRLCWSLGSHIWSARCIRLSPVASELWMNSCSTMSSKYVCDAYPSVDSIAKDDRWFCLTRWSWPSCVSETKAVWESVPISFC